MVPDDSAHAGIAWRRGIRPEKSERTLLFVESPAEIPPERGLTLT
jgi:hypothetical protein